MGTSHKRILIFNIVVFMILCFNSFIYNFLIDYVMILFLGTLLFLYRLLFGYEKDRFRYTKDIIMEVIIFLLIFFIMYYLFGLIIGFARTTGYLTLSGLLNIVIPSIIIIIITEIYRYTTIVKSQDNMIVLISSIAVLIMISITNPIYVEPFNSTYHTFLFIALVLLPAISSNVSLSLLTIKVGYKPLLVYSFAINCFQYFIPIIPDPNNYIASVLYFVLPIVLGIRIYTVLQKDELNNDFLSRDYNKKRFGIISIPLLITMVMVYFTSGLFNLWAIAIGSGSMSPVINKGDVVIIEKVKNNYEKIKEGQVLAYYYGDVIIVHRIIKIEYQDGAYHFYTKGDANTSPDDVDIKENMVVGIVNIKIPYIGIPSVKLSEL